jgi:tRNA pseudouridine38-40 synthase
MKNIFLKVAYLGTDYFGFQLQAKAGVKEITVQEVLETALEKLFKQKIRIVYSSRTDRGVHACAQGVNFKVDSPVPLENIRRALNIFLPPDIRILQAKFVSWDFHSRFDARAKTYRYIILNSKDADVFWHDRAWHVERKLDVGLMKKAAAKLAGKKDFKVLAKKAGKYHDCRRRVFSIGFKNRGGRFIYIDLRAQGFLYNMARNIVALLVECGLKRISPVRIPAILAAKAQYHPRPAPSGGLYLMKIEY